MTDFRITVSRNDATDETHELLGASAEPNFASDMEANNDLVLEDGHVFLASPQIDSVEVEEL